MDSVGQWPCASPFVIVHAGALVPEQEMTRRLAAQKASSFERQQQSKAGDDVESDQVANLLCMSEMPGISRNKPLMRASAASTRAEVTMSIRAS